MTSELLYALIAAVLASVGLVLALRDRLYNGGPYATFEEDRPDDAPIPVPEQQDGAR